MSILDNPTVSPARLKIIFDYVKGLGESGITTDDLERTISPPSLRNDQPTTVVSESIIEAKNFGILVQEGEVLVVPVERRNFDSDAYFRHLETSMIVQSEADEARQSDNPGGLAWFLSQSPGIPISMRNAPLTLINNQCGEDANGFGLTNDTRWGNFVYWSRFLGLARILNRSAIPDPTAAIRRHLPDVLEVGVETHVSAVLNGLASRIPVLEGGVTRLQVHAMFKDGGESDGQLSASTSLALSRLERAEEIELFDRSDDTERVSLLSPVDGRSLRTFSHVTRKN